jgi:hypothetical protein
MNIQVLYPSWRISGTLNKNTIQYNTDIYEVTYYVCVYCAVNSIREML